MGRIIRHEPERFAEPVAAFEVAPHRYTCAGFDDDYRDARTYREFMAGVPYKAGEVVYCERFGHDGTHYAAKALILDVFSDSDHFARYGDRREKYRVAFETKAGKWSRSWEYVHPGYVQRGYARAGLAPDYTDKLSQ